MRGRGIAILAIAVLFALAAAAILAVAAASPVDGRASCHPSWKCASPPAVTSRPSASPSPTVAPTSGPSPTPAPIYSFDDEFSGTAISPVWIRHFSCCGTLAGFDPSLATVSGGYLHLSVVDRSTGWWAYLLDTKTTFTQRYGYFEARMQIPKGAGLWPAFWMYSTGYDEIDTMEVCANPLGANGGNDASLLHTTVHYGTGQQLGHATRTVDLSLAFHTYGVDWRPDHLTFYLDGAAVFTVTDAAAIPAIAEPLIVNLGIGGSWCGAAGTGGTMLVDWIRARP